MDKKSNNLVEDAWKSLYKNVMDEYIHDVGYVQYTEMRRCFYSGAYWLYKDILMFIGETSDEATTLERLDTLQKNFDDFIFELKSLIPKKVRWQNAQRKS